MDSNSNLGVIGNSVMHVSYIAVQSIELSAKFIE